MTICGSRSASGIAALHYVCRFCPSSSPFGRARARDRVNQIASASALLLAIVLGWAGVAKLRDLPGTARSFAALGLRVPVVIVVGAELATGLVLVLRPRSGGIAATVLLSAFTVVIVRALAARQTVTCGCFGSASNDPVGPATVVRNVLLLGAGATALAAARPEHSLAALLTVALAAVVGLVVVTLVGLRATVGGLLSGPDAALIAAPIAAPIAPANRPAAPVR